MLVQEQVIQSLDLNEIDLVKEELGESEMAPTDVLEKYENEKVDDETVQEMDKLVDNVIESPIQKIKEKPITRQPKEEKTFDRFLDLMEIF